ncbi:hypothetical protein BJV82DRAFT_521745, partial [Fennellomyces sp. T-0311]
RLATVMVSAPLAVVTSWILYKRCKCYIRFNVNAVLTLFTVVLGEERRYADGRPVRPAGVRERDEKLNKEI